MSCAGQFQCVSAILGEPAGVPAAMALQGAVSPAARHVVTRLNETGHQAVLVGGAVRDTLAGKSPHDIDIATSATPEQVKAAFLGQTRDAGGEQYGTVLVIPPGGEQPMEVTTFRQDMETDGKYAVVSFTTDPVEDLKRRDFTVNALAFDPTAGRLYGPGPGGDPTQALTDLKNGTIRFVGDGLERIRENQPRALRLPRFAAKLGGQIDPAALAAVRQAIDLGILPGKINGEGVRNEALKTLNLPNGVVGLRMWQDLGLMRMFLPEVAACAGQAQNTYHGDADVLEHLFAAAEAVDPAHPGLARFRSPDKGDDETMPLGKFRLVMLLHDIGKPPTATLRDAEYGYQFLGHDQAGAELAAPICQRLRLDTVTREAVILACAEHMKVPQPDATPASIRRWARKVGAENVEFLLAVREADWGAGGRPGKTAEARRGSAHVRQVLAESPAQNTPLAVNGGDVMAALGLKRGGPEVGRAVRYLTGLVDDDPEANEHGVLLAALKNWRDEG